MAAYKAATSAAATSVTLPTHAPGDLILIWAYRDGNTTPPSVPSASGTVPAWADILAPTGANTNSARSAYFVATAANHTSGTWANATGIASIVISDPNPNDPIGDAVQSGATANNQAIAPALTVPNLDGTSVFVQFYGHRTVTAWSTAPSGYTARSSAATEVLVSTKDTTTTDGSVTQSATSTASGYRGEQIEVLARIPAHGFVNHQNPGIV